MKHNILFVCIHNSARSQMAEAFLKQLGGEHFEAESAGLEPGNLNPNVVRVLAEVGIDISRNATKDVFELFRKGKPYNAIITVCDAASAGRCPVFPGTVKRLAWSFTDPSQFIGTPDQVLEQTRMVRDQIKEQVTEFVREASEGGYWRNTNLTSE